MRNYRFKPGDIPNFKIDPKYLRAIREAIDNPLAKLIPMEPEEATRKLKKVYLLSSRPRLDRVTAVSKWLMSQRIK